MTPNCLIPVPQRSAKENCTRIASNQAPQIKVQTGVHAPELKMALVPPEAVTGKAILILFTASNKSCVPVECPRNFKLCQI